MSAKHLLVRVDDAGSSLASNLGCLEACLHGIARSVEVMVPGPWVAHAAHLFAPHPQIDIGLHITLTSEWDGLRWRPLTHAPSLIDESGAFLPLLLPRAGDPRPSLAERDWSMDEIAAEIRAQINLGRSLFPQASHVSTHMARHLGDLHPALGDLLRTIARKAGLKDDPMGSTLPRLQGYAPHPRAAADRLKQFETALQSLDSGTNIFVDHPARDGPELRALGHAGYRDVAADRASCLTVLTSPDLRATLDAQQIELIAYRDL